MLDFSFNSFMSTLTYDSFTSRIISYICLVIVVNLALRYVGCRLFQLIKVLVDNISTVVISARVGLTLSANRVVKLYRLTKLFTRSGPGEPEVQKHTITLVYSLQIAHQTHQIDQGNL